MACVLHPLCCNSGGSSHGHSHFGISHSSTVENINVRAALIHVLGDFLQSIGVIIAALVIYYKVGSTSKIVLFFDINST